MITVTEVVGVAAPACEIFVDSFPAGTTTVTLRATSDGREREVRGAVKTTVAGSLTKIDFDVPSNVGVTYRAECFNSDGDSFGFTGTGTITIESVPTWLHNPLNPQGAVKVVALEKSAASLSRPVPGTISYPLGRRVGVVLSESVRRGLDGLVFDVFVDTLEDADAVQALIGTDTAPLPPVVCVRKGSREGAMRIPSPLYLGVLNIVEEDVSIHLGGTSTIQRMTGDEVASPIPGLFIPLLTRADLDAYYATRGAMDADNATRSDIDRRYDLAGYAS